MTNKDHTHTRLNLTTARKMGKKRSREVDGQGDVTMADPAVDKKNEDDSSDDEVRTNSL